MRFPKKSHRLPISYPRKSAQLAEFIGIMMGDGGMSRYQVAISLHRIDDSDFSMYVRTLIAELFGVMPSIYDRKRELLRTIVVSRAELVCHLHSLGLPIGNKVAQCFDVPVWIRENERFLIACIRGLIDTDGSVFTHRYRVKGTWYAYKKLSFTSASEPLLMTVKEALASFGMNPRLGRNKDMRLDSKADMQRYFSIIGTSNPKHLRRYRF